MGVGVSMEHRVDFFMNILSTVFPIIIQVFLWSALYGENRSNNGNSMYGFTFGQMMVYVFLAGAISKFVNTGVEMKVNDDIHSGALAKYLVMPVSYLGFRLACAMGEKLFAMLVMLILTCAVIGGFSIAGMYRVNAAVLLLFVPALFLGLMLNFFLFTLISYSAFWITEARRLFHTVVVVVMVFSGGVFPVDIFGTTAKKVLDYLPFTYTIGFPIRVASGSLSILNILTGLLIQFFWIFVLILASRIVWNIGNKKFSAVGG